MGVFEVGFEVSGPFLELVLGEVLEELQWRRNALREEDWRSRVVGIEVLYFDFEEVKVFLA